jgi:hypothetical protein
MRSSIAASAAESGVVLSLGRISNSVRPHADNAIAAIETEQLRMFVSFATSVVDEFHCSVPSLGAEATRDAIQRSMRRLGRGQCLDPAD